uniref:Zinc metalloproteinase acutolysin-C n=1 Tax=Zeugodacus cucurbitae TaxID=28588 RepID=A0A0A1WQF4_ZEUCU
MAPKPQLIYLLICAFFIAHRISTACAQIQHSHSVEGSSSKSMDSFESALHYMTPANETEVMTALMNQLLIELAVNDENNSKAEPLSETERQEVNVLLELALEELNNSTKLAGDQKVNSENFSMP